MVATKKEAPLLLHTPECQGRRPPVICSHPVIVHPGGLADDIVPCGWPILLALALQPFNERALVHQRLGPSPLGLQGVSHTTETEDEDGRHHCKVRTQMANRAKKSPCFVLLCTCGDRQHAIHLSGRQRAPLMPVVGSSVYNCSGAGLRNLTRILEERVDAAWGGLGPWRLPCLLMIPSGPPLLS